MPAADAVVRGFLEVASAKIPKSANFHTIPLRENRNRIMSSVTSMGTTISRLKISVNMVPLVNEIQAV